MDKLDKVALMLCTFTSVLARYDTDPSPESVRLMVRAMETLPGGVIALGIEEMGLTLEQIRERTEAMMEGVIARAESKNRMPC